MAKAREIHGLDCEGPASVNVALILRTRLEEMCELRDKAVDWRDMEGVHDMRVASRRLRSALSDFVPYLSEEKAPRKQVKEIARILGSVRDEDVAILALKKLRRKVKGAVAAGIKRLIEERRNRQAEAREQLTAAIKDEAIVELQEKFEAWLQSTATVAENTKEKGPAGLTFKAMAREVILSQYNELDRLSHSLFHPFDVEPLHDMRIAAKSLRYSLELFTHCFRDELTEPAKEIAELQSSLGDLHDCDVWIEDLGARLAAPNVATPDDNNEAAANNPDPPHHAATTWLLKHFVKERTKHYTNALTRWSEWQATGFHSSLIEKLQEPPQSQPLSDQ